jgi:hypothetical protein
MTLHCKAIHITVKRRREKMGKCRAKRGGEKKIDSMRKEKWWMMFFLFF